MPRLPQPSLALKGHHGHLLEPVPLTRPAGVQPISYRPVAARVVRSAARAMDLVSTTKTVPFGYVDVAVAATALGRPQELLVLRALNSPQRLPRHVVVDGRPFFDPTDLPGVPA